MLLTLKTLLRRPGYFLLLAGVLAAGSGAGLGLYSIADAVLFRPLPVADPEKLVIVTRTDERGEANFNWSLPMARDQLGSEDAFSNAAWYADWLQFTLSETGSERVTLKAAAVSGGYFELMGVNPVAGRLLGASDDVQGAAPVAVISAELWRSRFDSDPNLIGSTLQLNAQPVTVVGIAPPGFAGVSLNRKVDVWMPLATGGPMGMGGFDAKMLLDSDNFTWLDAVVRLASEVSFEQAQSLFMGRRVQNTESGQFLRLHDAREFAMDRGGSGTASRIAWLLLALVAVIVIVACTDAAGLMLVRAEASHAASAIRFSLGASRLRLLSETLLEALFISLCAGLVGLVLAATIAHALLSILAGNLPLPQASTFEIFNPRSLAVYGGMMLITTVLTASAAMWRLSRVPLTDAMHMNSETSTRRFGIRELLVALQVGVSVALITTAFMFIGALRETVTIDPGFTVENRAVASINLLAKGGFDKTYAPILKAVRDDPRVKNAALAGAVPVVDFGFSLAGNLQAHPSEAGEPISLETNAVSDGYFETMEIPLLAGRTFPAMDGGPVQAAIVNEAFAKQYWPDRSPLGLTVSGLSKEPLEIIGVVADNKQRDLREAPLPQLFVPYGQLSLTSMSIVAAADNSTLAMQAIRETTRRIDPDIAIEGMESLQARVDRTTARDRAMTLLAAIAAAFATVLAMTGMYGTAAYAIRQRRREVGVRYALGATRQQVVLRFLKSGLLIVAVGTLVGVIAAWLGGRQLQGVVAGADINPVVVVVAACMFAFIALLANLLPVWRGAQIAPMEVLRDD